MGSFIRPKEALEIFNFSEFVLRLQKTIKNQKLVFFWVKPLSMPVYLKRNHEKL